MSRKVSLFLLLLLWIMVVVLARIQNLPVSHGQTATPSAQELSEIGREQGNDFQYDSAIASLDQAIALEPDNPALYTQRGQLILLLYEWDRVLADYNTALELDPNYAPAYFYRGVLFYTQGPRSNALPDFQRYLALAPQGEFATRAAEYAEDLERTLSTREG